MKNRALFSLLTLSVFLLVNFSPISAQEEFSVTQGQFNAALKNYVKNLLLDFGEDAIDRERFIVQQIRMMNEEIKNRIPNVNEIRQNYFSRLETRLTEIREMKNRLSGSGTATLIQFINELEQNIEQTINSGTIDFKKQKVIEDATQLLHVAEEVVKLDPNARLDQNADLAEGLRETKSDFVQSFGSQLESGYSSAGGSVSDATIFDVYNEWKRTERTKYQVRWTDIQLLKGRLLKNSTEQQKQGMYKRELSHAAEMFNYGYYDLADRSFAEIITRYPFNAEIDDILYYKGESNFALGRYNQAREDYTELINKFPSSAYIAKTYRRLMQVEFHYDNHAMVLRHLDKMRALVSSSDSELEQSVLIAAISALKGEQYENAVNYAMEISPGSPYYRQTRFILGEAYAGANNLDEAAIVFRSIIEGTSLNPDFRFTVLLKLGYISYELGDYQGAINYFDQIGGTYKRYDRVLIGYAWASYKMQLAKTLPENRDFSFTKKNLEVLIDIFFGSDYYLEAKTLLGFIYQLEQDVERALSNYEYAFNSKDVKLLSDRMIDEREQLKEVMSEAQKLENKALASKNPQAFERARKTKNKFKKPYQELSYSDLSSTGIAASNEVERLQKQLDELDRLHAVAEERGRDDLVGRIEDLQLRIYRAVNSFPQNKYSPFGINYFDEHPLARKESMVANENDKILSMREETKRQRAEVRDRIADLNIQIQNAKSRRDYKKMIHLELTRDRLDDLMRKLDFVETQAYSFDIRKTNINLDRWSDYGAFGMANVNFAVRKMKSQQVASIQQQIQQINDFLQMRKDRIEHKINQIEDEITLMTRQVRRQERLREREELERQFKETYFDTHDSELDYNPDTTELPSLEDEE